MASMTVIEIKTNLYKTRVSLQNAAVCMHTYDTALAEDIYGILDKLDDIIEDMGVLSEHRPRFTL
jgi:hypothetical protein